MKEITTKGLEKTGIYILILGCLGLLFFRDERILVSFALGSGLMIMNMRVLRWILEAALKREEKKRWLMFFLPLQFVLLLGLISILFLYGNLHPIFFLLGISTFFISVLINSFEPLGRQNDGT